MNYLTWLATIKLGKVKVIDRLNRIGITFPEKLNYFKLCSLLYQYLKSISNWWATIATAASAYGLTAELQSRYEYKATLHNQTGKRIGRLWQVPGDFPIAYDKSTWSQWRIGTAASYSEALETIAS